MINSIIKPFKNFPICFKFNQSATRPVTLIKLKQKNVKDMIFVRHANSQFNKACQEYRQKYKIKYDWELLCKHPGFQQAVAYNPDYFDCSLTQKGHQQCYLTGHNIDPNKVDAILVSPHQRTLETCSQILKYSKIKHNVPVIVEPKIAGSLWSSCDISKNVEQKQKQFPRFDFSRMKGQPQLWFIENLLQQDKNRIYQQIQRRKLKNFKDKQLLILQMLKNKFVHQDRKILRNRAWQIKKLMQSIKQKHFSVLIISHYYIIQYVNAKSFNNIDNTPIQDIDLKNCYPYYSTLQQLINNQK